MADKKDYDIVSENKSVVDNVQDVDNNQDNNPIEEMKEMTDNLNDDKLNNEIEGNDSILKYEIINDSVIIKNDANCDENVNDVNDNLDVPKDDEELLNNQNKKEVWLLKEDD